MAITISKLLSDCLWRIWYPLLTRLSRKASVVFLNYGYDGYEFPEKSPTLEEQDEADRVCIQLYHRVATTIDLRGLRVLEVSCGHGGGAAYIARYLRPQSVQGVDRNPRAIQFCKIHHQLSGLNFSRGDAMALGYANESFDAVLNIEASHCYPDVQRFFGEVYRVLRPGGHFLYADFRSNDDKRNLLDPQLKQSGLKIVSCHDISANVVRGMRLNSEKYLRLIKMLMPALFQARATAFAGIEGSAIYDELASGTSVYFLYHLRKPLART